MWGTRPSSPPTPNLPRPPPGLRAGPSAPLQRPTGGPFQPLLWRVHPTHSSLLRRRGCSCRPATWPRPPPSSPAPGGRPLAGPHPGCCRAHSLPGHCDCEASTIGGRPRAPAGTPPRHHPQPAGPHPSSNHGYRCGVHFTGGPESSGHLPMSLTLQSYGDDHHSLQVLLALPSLPSHQRDPPGPPLSSVGP